MIRYITGRTVSMLVVLVLISVVTFSIVFLIPGDPAQVVAGLHASTAVIATVRHNLGLDRPVYVQYFTYMHQLLSGNLGYSYINDMPVSQLIFQRLGNTVLLAFGGWIVEVVIGISLGILTAMYQRSVLDYVISLIALIGISIPVFWFGMWLIDNVAYRTGWFPLEGAGGFSHLVLPAIALGITGAAVYQRMIKTSMQTVFEQDYIRTAYTSGVSPLRVVFYHAFRNAIIPTLTYAGMDIANLLGGVVLVETVFNYPGVGLLALQAIQNSDIPVIMGTVLLAAVFVVVFNFVVDLLYFAIDPRISHN